MSLAASGAQESKAITRKRRHLNILALAGPLHRQASELQTDVNASFLLVHTTMSKAFTDHDGAEPLAETLHADLLQTFHDTEPSESDA